MPDVPKIALNRLRVTAASDAHPEAELLTAFAEHSLSESERSGIVDHLSRCGDCRELVALALPVAEEVAPAVILSPARAGWLNWPVLRWGVVVTGILLVASSGILYYSHRPQQNAALVPAVGPQRSAEPAAEGSTASSPAAVSRELPNRKASEVRAETKKDISTRVPEATAASNVGNENGFSVAGKVDSNTAVAPASHNAMQASAKQSEAQKAVPAGEIPQSSEMVEVQTSEISNTAHNQASDELVRRQKPALQDKSSSDLDVVKSKNPAPVGAAASGAPAPAFAPPSVPLQTAPFLMKRAAPRWSISSEGTLQRSFDAGNTWEDVDVNASAGSASKTAPGSYSYEMKTKKPQAQSMSDVTFRAVAAVGPEVWAGGSGAMLYHSVDSGTRWTRVLPAAAGAAMKGNVMSIQFADAQNGTVTTSEGEVWITNDSGLSWRRQQ